MNCEIIVSEVNCSLAFDWHAPEIAFLRGDRGRVEDRVWGGLHINSRGHDCEFRGKAVMEWNV